jgi:DNA polymerase-3 subunit alpha
MGYVNYYLIIWDVINYAKVTGYGRSRTRQRRGSIAAYALKITNLDPLKYQLIFERFLNPERVSMPDFDLDLLLCARGEVIDYVIDKYGADHVAQIITFGTMKAKAVVRDVGRATGMSYADADAIAKMIPDDLGMTLRHAMEHTPELMDAYNTRADVHELLDVSLALEGMARHSSTHAAGVVVADRPITDYVPVQVKDNAVTTQFTMGTGEELGLLKIDFLGLRTLTVLRDAIDLVKQRHGIDIDLNRLTFDDKATYEMMGNGDTTARFSWKAPACAGIGTAQTGIARGYHRNYLPVSPRPDGIHPALHRGQTRRGQRPLPAPVHEADFGSHLRLHRLSGAGHPAGSGNGRLFDGPGGYDPPGDEQKEKVRNGQTAGNFHPWTNR